MVESERLSETDTHALLGTSIAAVVAVTVWWSLPTHATQRYSDVSIDALGMMVTTTNLPRDPTIRVLFFCHPKRKRNTLSRPRSCGSPASWHLAPPRRPWSLPLPGDQGCVANADIHGGAIYTNYDFETSVYRFVGPKRIERIAGVYEAGVAAVA